MIKIQTLFFAFVIVLTACSTSKTLPKESQSDREGPNVIMDSMEIITTDESLFAEEPEFPYRPAEERTWDLLHTMLDLSFDWNKSTVIGKATLTLSPLFYPQNQLHLDAVNFTINKLRINGKESTSYNYDKNEIVITLPQTFTRRDKVTIDIDYIAKPTPGYNTEGIAITSNQGLYFIDPLDTTPDLPRQIWTQGETTSNRNWFPTIDQPNERATQEIILTVADSFVTLSNGSLLSSTKLNNGMRRDHWKLELPHAPYLAMVAVGKWDLVSDTWRGRSVDYYVDPGYGKDARAIFAHTPEMIDFFTEILGVDFVWPKYSQIIVKDFVSGAMENTTAVVFGDFIQFHAEDMLEEGLTDYIVSPELFHHWFGDLVTTESWANLTLNEGFANYAEYLWAEHKYGRDRADVTRISELSGYFDQAGYDAHPLIHYHYADENAMFDAHSYNKGGLVLHMLRDLVGDEAFFASLRLYLQRHAYAAVEVDDLRQAFEEITGKDLNWFFNQWYFGKGHPVLEVDHHFDATAKQLTVNVNQVQDQHDYLSRFRLPIEIGVYFANGGEVINKVWVEEKKSTFTFDLTDVPVAVVLDPRDILLTVVQQEIPASEHETRLLRVPSITHRISAFKVMDEIPDHAIEKMLADSSTTMRGLAIQYLAEKGKGDRLYELSKKETNLDLRFFILQSLTSLDPVKAKDLAVSLLETSNKNPIIYEALRAIAFIDIDAALSYAAKYENNPSDAVFAARASLYAKKGTIPFEFFTSERAKNISLDYLEEFIVSFAQYLSKQDQATQQKGIDLIKSGFFQQGPVPQYRRFYIITGLINHYASDGSTLYKENLRQLIKYLYEQETDPYLKEVLGEGLREFID